MRYYIVDLMGNVWGDFNNYEIALIVLHNYSEDQIKNEGLEIIKGR